MKHIIVPSSVLQLAETQAGALTTSQAVSLGMSTWAVHQQVRCGEWHRRSDGLLVVAGAPPGWMQDLWLAHLGAGPNSAVSGRAAARRHGLRGYKRPVVEVVVPLGRNTRTPLGRLRRTRWLPPEHVVTVDGLRVTSVARTVFDLAGDPDHPMTFRREGLRELHKRHMARVANDALRRHGLTMRALVRVLAALGRRGRAGTTIMRELVAEFGADYVPTESDLEDMFLDVVRAEGVEEPDGMQVDISGPWGWIGRVDFLYRRRRVIVEVDGPDHDSPLQRALDRERDRELFAAGWTVVRIHWTELVYDPESVVARLRDALAAAA